MKKHYTCLAVMLIAIIVPLAASAQTTVSGTVSSKGTPLDGASVTAAPSGKGVVTDSAGRYSLQLTAGSFTLTYSFAGYVTQKHSVQLSGGEDRTLNIEMAESALELEGLVVTGSRSLPRTQVSTPLPIDVLSAADLQTTGQTSFDKQLQYRVPSFNTINTPVNDATTLLDPYEIRNLGPSRTLMLINGKRKNLSSLLYVQFAPGRGETGADLSAIPIDAIKRVEILRDGASAQYGSDAIAGVMNVMLKDYYQYSSLIFRGGVTHEGDGGNYGLAFNSGSNIGGTGYLNYTIDFSQSNNAIRSGTVHRPTEKATFGGTASADAAIDAFLNVYPTALNTNGTGESSGAKFLFNLGLPTSPASQFYANGAVVAKRVLSNANYRAPYWKQDAGLLHTRVPGAPNYTGTGDPLYEGYIGFEPTFEGNLLDFNTTLGIKSERNQWNHDVSLTFGGNQQLYSVDRTWNEALGTASPTYFKPGGYFFGHIVGNYDLSRPITDNLTVAFGAEVRNETYQIIAGDTASYSGSGAISFPGIREENAKTNSRFNAGAYLDATWNVTQNFLLNGAIRGEKYSDFGEAFVWKVSSRYRFLEDQVVLRASASTGFRAPTLHQIYAQSTQASFVGGFVQLSGLFNNRSKEAFVLGVPRLKPEESQNYTVGLGLNLGRNLSVTFDYYSIVIRDRIVYSSSISDDDPNSTLGQILADAGVVNAQFFINGIKTRTEGLDLVASYRNLSLGAGTLLVNLAGNYTFNNEVVGTPKDPPAIAASGETILSTQIKSLLTESRPEYKGVLGFDYRLQKWNFSLNNTLFGPTRFQDLENGGADMENIKQEFEPAVVTDLMVGYNFSDKVSFSVAANNLFNKLPKWELVALNPAGQAVLDDKEARELLEGFLSFSGRYSILGYNGSQFSQVGTVFQATLALRF
jgi:iron complex outermembrane recepter protein